MSRSITIAHTLFSFDSKRQASHIASVLGRIGDIGGQSALEITPTDIKVGGKTIHELRFDVEAWAKAAEKVGNVGVKRILSASLGEGEDARIAQAHIDSKVAILHGIVRGLVYAAKHA